MTTKLPRQMQRTVHAIHYKDGSLKRITINTDEAEVAVLEGHTVSMDTPVYEIMDEVIAHGNPSHTMDDQTWRFLRSEMKSDDIKPEDRLFIANPPDLPCVLAEGRLTMTIYYPHETIAQDYLELSEISMAAHNRRPVELGVFSSESRNTKYSETVTEDIKELERNLDAISEQVNDTSSQNASERAMFGDSGPGSAIYEASLRQVERELAYALKMALPDEDLDEAETLMDSDIPY